MNDRNIAGTDVHCAQQRDYWKKGLFSELKIHILVHWNEHYHKEQILSVRNDDRNQAMVTFLDTVPLKQLQFRICH